MTDLPNPKLSLPLGREREYFPPEIVFDPNDNDRCSSVVYLPRIINAEAQPLNTSLEKLAWEVFLKNLRVDYADADIPGVNQLTDKIKSFDDNEGNAVIYISLDDDPGKTTLGKTKELQLCRYGKQIIRVYGPDKIKVWENTAGWVPTEDIYVPITIEKEIDLGATEKLIIFHQIPKPADELEKEYHIDTSQPDPEFYSGRAGSMGFKNEVSYKSGRFFQQQKDLDTFDVVSYSMDFIWAGKHFHRTFILPGNRGEYKGNQVKRVGRKSTIVREVLRFNGSTDQTIKYWYDDPIVTVLSWTQFVDEEGKVIEYRPNNAPLGEMFKASKLDFSPKRGRTFHADKKCWGSMWVEYTTTYTEFEIIYDFPSPCRIYEISAGNIERLGYQVVDKKGKVIDQGDTLDGVSFEYDKKVPDPDWVRENKGKISPTNLPPKIAVRLFKKIQLKDFTPLPIEILYTNGRQAASATFNPPAPNFMDMPTDEIPKLAIFEKRVREKAGGATVDHVEEITYLDIMGNVTTEKLERRRDEA